MARVESLNNQLLQELHGNVDSVMWNAFRHKGSRVYYEPSIRQNPTRTRFRSHNSWSIEKAAFPLIQFKLLFHLVSCTPLCLPDKGRRQRGTAAEPSNTSVRASCRGTEGIREPAGLQDQQSKRRGYGKRRGGLPRSFGPGHGQGRRFPVV